jgi:hypothetical protein
VRLVVVLPEVFRVVVLLVARAAVARRVGAFGVAATGAAAAADSWFSRDIKRDFRLAAAFRWTIPFWAALSSARTAARTTSAASPAVVATASAAFFTYVRTDERAARFRAARRSA